MAQLIIGVEAHRLTAQDQARLCQPQVAGVILFSRNFQDLDQLSLLIQEIRACRDDLLISVDHEGGRVQRFREGFSLLPKAASYAQVFRLDPAKGLAFAYVAGQVLATELLAHGIDLSYTPVLDLDYGVSQVIGDRSFGVSTFEAASLARAHMAGLFAAGMAAVGKHFPGHGGVEVDTHGEIAIDPRHYDYLHATDMAVFKALIDDGLPAIMPAHVIYPQVDDLPAGFSSNWMQKILRQEYQFQGAIISDDLDMAGAGAVGDLLARLTAACQAGCDLILLCNDFESIDLALQHLPVDDSPVLQQRLAALRPKRRLDHQALLDPAYVQCHAQLTTFLNELT
jgi:beta-N-acetylhexosaminidase